MSVRRSGRPHIPALNPEQRMVPLVDRGFASRRTEESSDDDIAAAMPASHANPPPPGATPDAQGPLSEDHPIEGPDWKERQILGFVFGDGDWQQMLRDAAEWGDEYNNHEIEGIFVRGARIAPAMDGHSSTRAGEKHDEESGRTDVATVTQTTTASAVSARPTVAGEAGARRRERMGGDNPGTNPGSRPSGIVGEPSFRRERRVGDFHGENTGTRPSGSVDGPSLLAIGLRTASGEILEVVSSMKAGRSVSVAEILDHLKKDADRGTYDLRQRLGVMPADTVEICTAKKPTRIRQAAASRGKWGDVLEVLGRLQEVETMRHLAPCVSSEETEKFREGLDASSYTPIFVLYLFEIPVGGPSSI